MRTHARARTHSGMVFTGERPLWVHFVRGCVQAMPMAVPVPPPSPAHHRPAPTREFFYGKQNQSQIFGQPARRAAATAAPVCANNGGVHCFAQLHNGFSDEGFLQFGW
jgi:hypothetical protein